MTLQKTIDDLADGDIVGLVCSVLVKNIEGVCEIIGSGVYKGRDANGRLIIRDIDGALIANNGDTVNVLGLAGYLREKPTAIYDLESARTRVVPDIEAFTNEVDAGNYTTQFNDTDAQRIIGLINIAILIRFEEGIRTGEGLGSRESRIKLVPVVVQPIGNATLN